MLFKANLEGTNQEKIKFVNFSEKGIDSIETRSLFENGVLSEEEDQGIRCCFSQQKCSKYWWKYILTVFSSSD